MATRAEVEQVSRALNRLSSAAEADFRRIWDSLRASDRVLMSRALRDGWIQTIEAYGDMTATLAADLFEVQAGSLGVRPRTKIAPGVDADRAASRLGYALSAPDQRGNALVILDQLVKQPYRATMQDSAWASGLGWARVPSGATTCAWCLMLSSRGAVYHSKELAKYGTKGKTYHGACDCAPVLVRGPQDYPDGYDPDGLYDQYSQARHDAGSGDPRAILSTLRQQQGIH